MIALALRALTFLKSPAGRWLCIAIVAALALWGFGEARYRAGVAYEVAAQAKQLEKAQKHVAKVEAKSAEIGVKAGEKLEARKVEIRTITQTLIKEIPYAVPSDPARPSLPVGLVRLHDAAVLGLPGLSDPAGRADGEASGVTDAAAAPVLIANAETCRINAETVIAWQAYWADLAEANRTQ